MNNDKNESFNSLIDEVKNYCYITSQEPQIERKIKGIVKSAITTISSMIGISQSVNFDFLADDKSSELLLLKDYCMYKWNDKTDKEFSKEYLSTIIRLRAKYEVKYEKEKKSNE